MVACFCFFANVAERESFWPLEINIIYRMDYRRTPMYPPRRGIGGSDMADQRAHIGWFFSFLQSF